MPALEQRHAQARLDLLDLAADGGLREKQLARCPREAQVARGRLETAQQVERGQLLARDGRRVRGFRILGMHARDSKSAFVPRDAGQYSDSIREYLPEKHHAGFPHPLTRSPPDPHGP